MNQYFAQNWGSFGCQCLSELFFKQREKGREQQQHIMRPATFFSIFTCYDMQKKNIFESLTAGFNAIYLEINSYNSEAMWAPRGWLHERGGALETFHSERNRYGWSMHEACRLEPHKPVVMISNSINKIKN